MSKQRVFIVFVLVAFCYWYSLLSFNVAENIMFADINITNSSEISSEHLVAISDVRDKYTNRETSNRRSASPFHECLHDKLQLTTSTLPTAKISIKPLKERHVQYLSERCTVNIKERTTSELDEGYELEFVNQLHTAKLEEVLFKNNSKHNNNNSVLTQGYQDDDDDDDNDDDDYIIHLPFKRSKLLKGPLRPLKIYPYFIFNSSCQRVGQVATTYINTGSTYTCAEDDIFTAQKQRFVEQVVKQALQHLSLVYRSEMTQSINVDVNGCSGLPTKSEQIIDFDFVLFITASPLNTEENTVAWARSCAYGGATMRPVIGHINFVPHMINRKAGNGYYGISMQNVIVAEHEITHALGFTNLAQSLWAYIDVDGNRHDGNGTARVYRPHLQKTVTIVKSPRVVHVARRYFNCTTLDGVEIEDSGGPLTNGAHWKKRILNDEALVGLITSAKMYYSAFTLAAMEDMGFYEVNYAYADHGMRWGFERGCAFVQETCKTLFDQYNATEFCFSALHDSQRECTFDRTGIGSCDVVVQEYDLPVQYRYYPGEPRKGGKWGLLDYCPVVTSYDNTICTDGSNRTGMPNMYGDEFGSASRCLYSNLISNSFPLLRTTARCFAATCTHISSEPQLVLRIQDQNVYCPANGQVGQADTTYLRGLHGNIECPAALDICRRQRLDGLSNLAEHTMYNSSVQHAVLDFKVGGVDDSMTCAERAVKCSNAHVLMEQTSESYYLCELLSNMLVECFGALCRSELRDWVKAHIPSAQTECLESTHTLSNRCLDRYEGSRALCALVTDASDTHLIIKYRVLLPLYAILIVIIILFVV